MPNSSDWIATAATLGRDFATRSAEHDEADSFVSENYAILKEHGLFAAGVPEELGGGGASHADLCAIVRELAHHCSSTALAFSMHTHLVATLAFAWRSGNKAPETMLRRVAAEKLVLVSSGGSDWLPGSGKLVKVEGGYRLTARKIFGSGGPSGDILMTTGIYDDPTEGPLVYHIPVSLKAEGVKILDTWKVLGMRGTGSHDIELKDVFVPDAATGGVKRPAGKWHPFMHTVCLAALPVFNAAYLGVAESARDLSLKLGAKKKADPALPLLVGEMENQLVTAQLAHASMVQMVLSEKPGPATSSAIMVRRTIFGSAAIKTVEKALEVAGGAGFYRQAGLERLFRDIQAVRYHPMTEKTQLRFTGQVLLGLDFDS
ncbi:MAG TPA: acyl-CoA dehydrogenase family protein [Polyangiaceae bacterium]|nr:acyl-CoA dehydrogenase family protein [Polyangiaceae bacterium]